MAPLVARLACLLAAAAVCAGFNLDTKHPVILQGPITDPAVDRGQSYFGYSIGLTTAPDTGSWVLVGAPRANSTLGIHDIPNTGAMYKCSLDLGMCEEVVTDTIVDRRFRRPPNSYQDYKRDAWIGGLMDVSPIAGKKVAVCGHRWANQYWAKERYMNGLCYWSDSSVLDAESNRVLPRSFLNNEKQKLEDGISFQNAYSQLGTSVHFAKNGSELLMGAPGVYNWKGTVVRLTARTSGGSAPNVRRRRQAESRPRNYDFAQTIIADASKTDALHNNDYFGYSVGSGEFLGDGETYYVAGAPRAALGKGKVFIFTFQNDEAIRIALEQTGSQVGEYFGAAVLGLDMNGDGRPELLVGAPQHSLGTGQGAPAGIEEGRVCVYTNLGRGELKEQPVELFGSRSIRARFGSAVTSVGDLDMDGYNDVAIGAPYEEGQRGAIYIYLGSPSGISPSYSQRIPASDISPLLRGFGVSISHGLDMDDNKYSDVAVGSYLSGQAVLLRSQPVLRFKADLVTSVKELRPNDRQFKVTACIKYFGKHLPDELPTEVLMKIESRHVRCAFDLSGGSRDNFTYTRMLNYGANSCNEYTVLIKSDQKDAHDFTQPIQLSMSFNISSDDSSTAARTHRAAPVVISTDITKRYGEERTVSPLVSGDLAEFCATCPVVNRLGVGQTKVLASVPFSIGCGDDTICQSDLRVAAVVRGLGAGEKFVIGASRTIDLDVNVTNVGEPASLPSVQVKIPPVLRLVRVPKLCKEQVEDFVLLTCDIRPHPFSAGDSDLLQLTLDTSDLKPGTEGVTVHLNVTSAGEELVAADNVFNFTLGLKTEADIGVTGRTLEETTIFYDKNADRDESEQNDTNYKRLFHRYQVLNYLPSPVEDVSISFLVPVNVTDSSGRELRVVDIFRPMAAVEGRQLTCSIETGYFLAGNEKSFLDAPRTRRRNYHLTNLQRQLLAPTEYKVEGNHTTILNCTQPFVSCVLLECGTVDFPKNETVTVTLEMRVKIHALEPYVGERDRLVISTVGMAEVGAVPYPLQPADGGKPDLFQVHSELLPSRLQPFPVWIIVVTVIGSLLLLAAITYGLYKVGFFKRRRPENV